MTKVLTAFFCVVSDNPDAEKNRFALESIPESTQGLTPTLIWLLLFIYAINKLNLIINFI